MAESGRIAVMNELDGIYSSAASTKRKQDVLERITSDPVREAIAGALLDRIR